MTWITVRRTIGALQFGTASIFLIMISTTLTKKDIHLFTSEVASIPLKPALWIYASTGFPLLCIIFTAISGFLLYWFGRPQRVLNILAALCWLSTLWMLHSHGVTLFEVNLSLSNVFTWCCFYLIPVLGIMSIFLPSGMTETPHATWVDPPEP